MHVNSNVLQLQFIQFCQCLARDRACSHFVHALNQCCDSFKCRLKHSIKRATLRKRDRNPSECGRGRASQKTNRESGVSLSIADSYLNACRLNAEALAAFQHMLPGQSASLKCHTSLLCDAISFILNLTCVKTPLWSATAAPGLAVHI